MSRHLLLRHGHGIININATREELLSGYCGRLYATRSASVRPLHVPETLCSSPGHGESSAPKARYPKARRYRLGHCVDTARHDGTDARGVPRCIVRTTALVEARDVSAGGQDSDEALLSTNKVL